MKNNKDAPIRTVNPDKSGVTYPTLRLDDVVCTICEKTISDEEINYGFLYWKGGKPFCHECIQKTLRENTVKSLESFLHDVDTGESNFEDVLNIMGYNELKYMIDCAKAFYQTYESFERVTGDMNEEYEKVVKEREALKLQIRNMQRKIKEMEKYISKIEGE